MDVQNALAFVDQRLHAKTGKHLNDLERKVFIGSWEGQTYDSIHPGNPDYVEKTVGYRLWQKLSEALDEKVYKKKLKGTVERAWQRQPHIFISYWGQVRDQAIAATISESLQSWGYTTFVSNLNAIAPPVPPDLDRMQTSIAQALERCHCFVLLLSAPAAVSEMALEHLSQLRREADVQGTPASRRVVIRLDRIQSLSHDLRHYLAGSYAWDWISEADTPATLQRLQVILEQDIAALATLPVEVLSAEPEVASSADSPPAAVSDPSPSSLTSVIYPLPGAEPAIPQGQVRRESRFYIERSPYEAQCYDAIAQSGALIRIKAPRQMGKTSLMARILSRAETQGYRAIPVTFQHADRAIFADLGSLLRWFCMKVARKLRLPNRLDHYWDDTVYGSKDNCTSYFEEYLLPAIETPLVLGLDEVDAVFRYPAIADDFFGLLRAWYEEASYGSGDSELWERLRLIVVHSTEVYLPLDVNQSPFNVGLPIELPEFTLAQVADLVGRYGMTLTTAEITSLIALVGGHPYLLRLALYHLAQQQLTLDELHQTGPTEAGIYSDHLRRHLTHLTENPDLAHAYRAILNASHPLALDSECMFKLHSLGLVHLRGNGAVPSFALYRRYFSDRLPAEPSR
ncbi:MAG: AAA-like domain-containing protein [Cyanobacteria bacterium J06638_6]